VDDDHLALSDGPQLGKHRRLGGEVGGAVGDGALAAAGTALLAGSSTGSDALTGVLPGFALAAAGLGMALVTATTTAMSRVDPHRAGMVSGVVNTAHELGAALGVALISTLASAGVEAESAAAATVVAGFGDAFLTGAIIAAVGAAAVAWLLPAGRPPASDRPLFAH
jgi:hypothetical protein